MVILDPKSLHLVSGAEIGAGDIKQGAQIGSCLGLVAGTIAGIKASGFTLTTYGYIYGSKYVIEAGQGSYLGLIGIAAAGGFLGFWGGALLGGAAVVGYDLHNAAYHALMS